MSSRAARARALIAAVLLVPLLTLCLVLPFVSHRGHDCPFDQECVACRWAADGVAEIATPVSLPETLAPAGPAAARPWADAADGSAATSPSRGPPPADA
jgi:hypothetical protein